MNRLEIRQLSNGWLVLHVEGSMFREELALSSIQEVIDWLISQNEKGNLKDRHG
jgi:hypothetical protein